MKDIRTCGLLAAILVATSSPVSAATFDFVFDNLTLSDNTTGTHYTVTGSGSLTTRPGYVAGGTGQFAQAPDFDITTPRATYDELFSINRTTLGGGSGPVFFGFTASANLGDVPEPNTVFDMLEGDGFYFDFAQTDLDPILDLFLGESLAVTPDSVSEFLIRDVSNDYLDFTITGGSDADYFGDQATADLYFDSVYGSTPTFGTYASGSVLFTRTDGSPAPSAPVPLPASFALLLSALLGARFWAGARRT